MNRRTLALIAAHDTALLGLWAGLGVLIGRRLHTYPKPPATLADATGADLGTSPDRWPPLSESPDWIEPVMGGPAYLHHHRQADAADQVRRAVDTATAAWQPVADATIPPEVTAGVTEDYLRGVEDRNAGRTFAPKLTVSTARQAAYSAGYQRLPHPCASPAYVAGYRAKRSASAYAPPNDDNAADYARGWFDSERIHG